MIVLKKLTAFAAALSLATPVSSFAQTSAPSPIYAHRKSAVVTPAKHALRRRGRGIASVDEPVVGLKPFKNPPARIVKWGNKSYVYAERYTSRGRLLSTVLVGQNYREIKVDEFGTGTASKWILTKDQTTMSSSKPYRGHFTKVQIEQRRNKDRLVLDFTYMGRIKRYHLDKAYTKKYAVLNADSVVFGDTCSLSNVQHLNDFRQIVDQLNNGDTSGSSLSCSLQAQAPLFMDKGCFDPISPMKDSIPDITKGLADLMESGPVKDTTSRNGYASSSSGTYLSCVEQHGLAEHSALIQGEISDLLNGAKTQINAAHAKGVISDAEYNAILHPTAPNCEVAAGLIKKIQDSASNPANSGKPFFACGQAPGTALAEKDSYRGNFISGKNFNQIYLGQPSSIMPSALQAPSKGYTAESAYASTLLHEFIHSSGVDDETLTLDTELCCAGTDSDAKAAACKRVDTRLVGSPDSYEAQNRFPAVMRSSISSKISDSTIVEYMNTKLNSANSGTDSQEMMDRYKQYMARKIEGESAARAKVKDKDGSYCAAQATETPYCVQQLMNFSETKLKEYTIQFLNDQCPIIMNGQNREDTSLCKDRNLKKELKSYVTYSRTVTGVTAALQPGDSSAQAVNGLPATDPYADLYSVQQDANPNATTADGKSLSQVPDNAVFTTPATAKSEITMKPVTKLMVASATDGQPSGAASNLTSEAVPVQPGVPSSSRPDGLDGSKPSEAVVDNAGKVATAIGNTVLPNADAATPDAEGPEIVVTAKSRPKKNQSTKTVSDSTPSTPLQIPWTATAAPVVAAADSSSGSDTSISAPTYNYTGGTTAPVISTAGSSSSGPANSGFVDSGAQPATNLSAPTGITTNNSGSPVAASSVGPSGTIAPPFGGGGSTGGGSAAPVAATKSESQPAARAPASAEIRQFRDAGSIETFLEHDYSKIEYSLEKTKMRTQLIDYRIKVIDSHAKVHGCGEYPGCTPRLQLNYCPRTRRLAPQGDC